MDSTIKDLFDSFVASDTAEETCRLYAQVCEACSCVTYESLRDTLKPRIAFSKRLLFDLLDARLGRYGGSVVQARVVIAGAGPVGLRSAVEAKLSGVRDVICYEARSDCTRHNILKTWNPTLEDAVSLGMAIYFPTSRHAQIVHAGTRELQLCYLKSGLLLGVKVVYGVAVKGVAASPHTDGKFCAVLCDPTIAKQFWTSRTNAADEKEEDESARPPELSLQPNTSQLDQQTSKVDFIERARSENGAVLTTAEPNETLSPEFDTIFDATGEQSVLTRHLGFQRKVARYGPAVGIVVNANFTKGAKSERQLGEFVVGRTRSDWRSTCLGVLEEQGILLENMEYMRGSTHFCVATARFESLVNLGVIKVPKTSIKDSLAPDNVDLEKLRWIARSMLSAAGVPVDAPLAASNGVHLFDFSCKGKLTSRIRFLSDTCAFIPIGDALQNPYWPQGLGINKGLHTGCDAVHATLVLVSGGRAAALLEREAAWRVCEFKFLSAAALAPWVAWTADPASRYSRQSYVGLDREYSLKIDYSMWSVSSPVCAKTHISKENAPDSIIIPDRIRILLRLPVLVAQ